MSPTASGVSGRMAEIIRSYNIRQVLYVNNKKLPKERHVYKKGRTTCLNNINHSTNKIAEHSRHS